MSGDEMTVTQRVGLATLWLATDRQGFTANELADRLCISPHGSRAMLNRLSAVLPLVTEPADNGAERWRILQDGE